MSISKERERSVPAATAGTGRAPVGAGLHRPWWVVAATMAALLVLLCVRNRFLFTTRLYEDADMGANSILIEQARHFTLLVGNYSRDHFHHPGPAYMYVQAAGESLFWAWLHVVPTAWNGQLLAAYALNAMFLALVVGMGYGWSRSLRGAAACFAVVVAFASVHPAVLSTDWMPYLYVPAYLAFIVAAASVAAGRARDAWIMALAGWFLIHGHACFLFFVPVISCAVLAAVLWRRRRRPRDLRSSVRSLLRHAVAGVGARGGHQRRFRLPDHREPGAALAGPVRRLPDVLLLQAGGRAQHRAGGPGCAVVLVAVPGRMGLRALPVAAFAVAAAVTRWLAPAPLRRFLWALLAVNAVSSVAFLYYATRGIDVISEHYVGYFYWSAPVITLLVIVLGVIEAMPPRSGTPAAAGLAVLALAALAVAPDTHTSTNSSDPAVLSSGPNTDPALPGAVSALAARSAGRMIVLWFDQPSWPDVTGFLVQAERTGVRACVLNPVWTFMMTSQFICTSQEIAEGRVYWISPIARGNTVIARLRQAVVTAGDGGP